jgi:tetratricopeptide (TPR) repeat protein
MRFASALLICCLIFAWSNSMGSSPSYPTIKKLYKEGEFEKIKVTLEKFLKENDSTTQAKDKIFAYKYLGVLYAIEPQGYPIAETYFYQLLELAPNAHISDLYVSTPVKTVFEKTQERFRKENREISEYDEFGAPRNGGNVDQELTTVPPKNDSVHSKMASSPLDTISSRPKPFQQKSKNTMWAWAAGGVTVLAIGGYLWYSSLSNGDKVVTIEGPKK